MPRIPSVDELPLVQTRPLASVSVDTGAGNVARALGGLGEALRGFGENLARQSDKARKADQVAKVTQQTAAAGGELADFARTLADDPDYESYPDRFKAKVEELRAKHRDGLDDDMAERFDARFRDHALARALEVRTLGTRRLVASADAALDGQLESLAGLAVAAGNDAGHRSLTAQAIKALDDHVEAGLIGQDDRDRRARRFLADVGERQAMAMARLDPDETARRLADPDGFPELDDERRAQLAGYARSLGRSLARDREIEEARTEADARIQSFEKARAFESDWRGRLASGGATLAELDDAVLRGLLAEGDAEALRGEAERAVERRKRESNLLGRVRGAFSGGEPLDPADEDDRAAANHVFETVYRPRLIEAVQDPARLIERLPHIAADVGRLGVVPEGLGDLVGAWWASGEPRFQAGAARVARMVYRPDGSEGEHAGGLPLGAMPEGVPERLDLAARLIEAGIPDDVAVRRAAEAEVRLSQADAFDAGPPADVSGGDDAPSAAGAIGNEIESSTAEATKEDEREADEEIAIKLPKGGSAGRPGRGSDDKRRPPAGPPLVPPPAESGAEPAAPEQARPKSRTERVQIGEGAFIDAAPDSEPFRRIKDAIETIPDGPSRRAAEGLINGGQLTTRSSPSSRTSDVTRRGSLADSKRSFDEAVRAAGGEPSNISISKTRRGDDVRSYIAADGTRFVHREVSREGPPTAEVQIIRPPSAKVVDFIKVRFVQ